MPLTHYKIPLPHIDLFGYDLSITKHVVMMWLAFGILFVLFRLAARNAKDPVPRGLRNALEVLVVFIRDEVAKRAIPTHAEQYTPFLLSTFFFIAAMFSRAITRAPIADRFERVPSSRRVIQWLPWPGFRKSVLKATSPSNAPPITAWRAAIQPALQAWITLSA